MAGQQVPAIDDAHLLRIGEHRQDPPHLRVGNGIIVQVEPDIGRLADADLDPLEQRRRIDG